MCTCNVAVNTFATLSLLFSSLFWVWALLTTLMQRFDFSVITYLGVVVSSIYLFLPYSRPPPDIAKKLVPATHIIVALHYVVTIVRCLFSEDTSYFYIFYCVVFAMVWLETGNVAWRIMGEMKAPEELEGEDSYLLDEEKRDVS